MKTGSTKLCRVYRTGDLVRLLYNGDFDFAGRADDQVKLRGQRLEIGEINATLKRADPRVKTAATLVLKHPKQQRDQLVSFISIEGAQVEKGVSQLIATGEHAALIGTLLSTCKRNLPVYMVPTHFLPLTAIPLSVNNKVDNKRLAKIYGESSLELLQSLAYREEKQRNLSAIEHQIQGILADVTHLQKSEIKESSTIFELGLDSVSVVGLARRLKKNGFQATISLIMQSDYPEHTTIFLWNANQATDNTLTKLAEALSENKNVDLNQIATLEAVNQKLSAFSNKNSYEVCEQLGVEQENVKQILPCSALQEGMILRFIDSDDPLYFVSFAFELPAGLNVEALRNAWITVTNSTDILRTCFCETSDGYAQVILNEAPIDWTTMDIDNDRHLGDILEKERNSLSRLNRQLHEPPIYFKIIHTPSKLVLALNIFHALYDGNSLPLILKDVEDAYYSKFSPRPTQFSDVIPHILSCDLNEAEAFWKKLLHSKRLATFPGQVQQEKRSFTLQQPLSISGHMIDDGSKVYGCTAQSLVQAAWASVLAPYIGNEVIFGVVVSGRTLPVDEVEGIIGPIFNTIPFHLHLSESTTWKSLVQQAHTLNADCIPYHHTPLRLIRKWLALPPERQVFDTLFVYQRTPRQHEATNPLWKPIESINDVDVS